MKQIKLSNDVWTVDLKSALGPPGGFGEVFRGTGRGGAVAIKRLKITAGAAAHREMDIGGALAGRELSHVVPVLDHGQDADGDRYYLVMPICDNSLQEFINEKGVLTWTEAKEVALDIIAGLEEVGDIVHRDLKPGNVLYHDGRWKIADFGIAKFVQDSTSVETLRSSLSPHYAAPEQWLGERPVPATDIYALACIIHAMINGQPPFEGSLDDVRDAHLRNEPPVLGGVDPRMEAIARLMLRKTAANRPSLARCKAVINDVTSRPLRSGVNALAEAGARLAREKSAAEAAHKAQEEATVSRRRGAEEAIAELKRLIERLLDEIQAASEITERSPGRISLGDAELAFGTPGVLNQVSNSQSGWDVMASAKLWVGGRVQRYSPSDPEFYMHSATLVYARTRDDLEYRWREVSFFNWTHGGMKVVLLEPNSNEFHSVFSNVTSGWQTAFGPVVIDGENEDEFLDRWISLFTKAVDSNLRAPRGLPITPDYFL